MSPAPHMLNLAAGLEVVMREMHPEYIWTAGVRERNANDRPSEPAITSRVDQPSAMPDRPHALRDRHNTAAAPDTRNDDRLDKAA